MPRSKTGMKRPAVCRESLQKAVNAVLGAEGKKISLREAERIYNIPKTTILRHIKKFQSNNSQEVEAFKYKSNIGWKKVFTVNEELSLVSYIQRVAKMNYGLTKKGVRELAYKFAAANKKRIPEKWESDKIAGQEWMRCFMRRHSNQFSLARSTSFNKFNVDLFFSNLEDIHRRFGPIPPERIWNVDESGCTTVQVPPRVVAPRGMKQVGSATSAERGQLVTIICGISGIGNFMPPMLIYPRVHFKEFMITGAPPGTLGSATSSGWSNEEQWLKYIKHFINHVNPKPDQPILLLIDNHETHYSIEAVELAATSGAKILTFPPHTTHRLQPLDTTVFGPFKTFYNQSVEAWHMNHPGKTFGIYNVAEIVGLAFPRAFTPSNICNGFKSAGIYPLNRGVFSEEEFLSAAVTDRADGDKPELVGSSSPAVLGSSPQASSSLYKSPEDVRPFPKAHPRKSQGNRKRVSTKILTDTPIRLDIQRKKKEKLKKEEKRKARASSTKGKKVSRKLFVEHTSSDSDAVLYQEESDFEGKTLADVLSSSESSWL